MPFGFLAVVADAAVVYDGIAGSVADDTGIHNCSRFRFYKGYRFLVYLCRCLYNNLDESI